MTRGEAVGGGSSHGGSENGSSARGRGSEAARVEDVLTAWFLEREKGLEVDLEKLCGGDDRLFAEVSLLIAEEPDVLRNLDSDPAAAPRAPEVPRRRPPILDLPLRETTPLGEFECGRVLGRGGMGTVYSAIQGSLGRRVALKVLNAESLGDERALLRFQREALVTAALEHPNIVPVYAIGEDDGQAFIAMKELSGPGLDEIPKPLPPEEVARIGQGVARALEAAHLAGVVHRDIKPANILLDDGVPRVVDFGLARSSTDPSLTSQRAVPGTLPYLAPELLGGEGPRLDPRSDIYALGATLYELLEGHPPFSTEDPVRMVRGILVKEAPGLGLPAEHRDLETIVLKALEKEPERRIPTAEAFADDLGRYLRGAPIRARPTRWVTRVVRLARRNRRTAVLITTLVLVLASLSALLVNQGLRARRSRATQQVLFEDALAAERFAEARTLLDSLEDDGLERLVVEDAEGRLQVARSTTSMAFALLCRPAYTDSYRLRSLVDQAEKAGVAQRAPELGRGLLTIAAWRLGEDEAARSHLEALKATALPPAALAALESLFENDAAPPASTPPEGSTSVQGELLRAIALVNRQRQTRSAASAFENVLDLAPTDRRARFGMSVIASLQGRNAAARVLLEELATSEEVAREVWLLLARVRFDLGQHDRARAALGRIPAAEWTAVEAYQDLEFLGSMSDRSVLLERRDALLADAERGRFAAPSEVYRAAAEISGWIEGDLPRARELFAVASSTASDSYSREMAAVGALALDVDHALAQAPADMTLRRRDLSALSERARTLSPELRTYAARGIQRWKAGMLDLFLGEAGRGFRSLEQAMDWLPHHPGPRLDFAEQALTLAQAAPALELSGQLAEGTQRFLELRVQQRLNEVLILDEAGEIFLATEEQRAFIEAALEVSARLADWKRVLEITDRVTASGPALARPERAEELRRVAQDGLDRVFGRER